MAKKKSWVERKEALPTNFVIFHSVEELAKVLTEADDSYFEARFESKDNGKGSREEFYSRYIFQKYGSDAKKEAA